jgi:hypothetical protein
MSPARIDAWRGFAMAASSWSQSGSVQIAAMTGYIPSRVDHHVLARQLPS